MNETNEAITTNAAIVAVNAPRPEIPAGSREVVITGNGMMAWLLVDDADYARVSLKTWRLCARGPSLLVMRRFNRAGRRRAQTLATFLLGEARVSGVLDRANGDLFDYRRQNLVIKRGMISFHPERSARAPWHVRISIDGRRYRCGWWAAKWQAETVRNLAEEAARELEGKNLPPSVLRRKLHHACGVTVARRTKNDNGESSL